MEVPSEIMARYIERRKQDLSDCLQELENKNYPRLEKLGHQLKGNGSTFGHPELSEMGLKLEKAAREFQAESCLEALQELSRWVRAHSI